jgi:hypothetical protein
VLELLNVDEVCYYGCTLFCEALITLLGYGAAPNPLSIFKSVKPILVFAGGFCDEITCIGSLPSGIAGNLQISGKAEPRGLGRTIKE